MCSEERREGGKKEKKTATKNDENVLFLPRHIQLARNSIQLQRVSFFGFSDVRVFLV
jgi:hypothetical protein